MFNRNKKYYKIFREDDNHNGFQYKDGLNIDTIPFNDDPNDSCCEGGLYFSDVENICEFLDMGDYIREVSIPEDAKVIKDPDGDKWRADRLFLHERRDLRKSETWEWMINQGINIHSDDDYALSWSAYKGHFDVVKFLVENNANIHADDDYALRFAAHNGYFDIVKFLVENKADIHINDDEALRCSASNGHKEIVEYLQLKMKEGKNV